MEVCLLRGVAARRADGGDVVIAGTGLQALLALLALAVPSPVSADRLIDELWGDNQPGNPDNALQAKISQLRRLLGRDIVTRKDSGYSLDVEPGDVDALRLEGLVRDGRAASNDGDWSAAAKNFAAALELQHGEPFRDLVDFRFARAAATRIEELVLAALEGLADCRLAIGQHADAIGPLMDAVREHPYRERFHAQLMLALYRCGRQAEAMRAYKAARDVLVEDLGLEPGSELQALQKAMLEHDQSLIGERSPVPPLPGAAALPGFRDIAAWRADIGSRDNRSTRMPFIGRAHEQRTIDAALTDLLDGSGCTVLLEGEPGIGKTRVAEELTRSATSKGITVVWSRCYDGRGAPSFWIWAQIVHGLLDRLDRDEFRGALGADASDLAQIAPQIKDLFDDLDPPAARDPESARFRICQAITGTLRRLSVLRPIVVVIDDLHWADQSSMDELDILVAGAEDHRLMTVATYRSVDPTIGDELTSLLAHVSARASVRRLKLAGLDTDELALLLSSAGATPTDELLSTMEERTRGNPFFVTEILKLIPGEPGAHDSRAVAHVVPSNVKEVILRRVNRLPDLTAEALLAASVLGHEFDLGLLSGMVGVDGAALLDRLEPAEIAGLIVESRAAVGRFRFSHGLVREAMYDDMGVARRARMHLRAGEAFEARHGDADGPHLVQMAEHWYHAVPAAPAEKGIEAARRAAMWALGRVADHQAERQLHAALEMVATLPTSRVRSYTELEILDQLSMTLIVNTSYTSPEIAAVTERSRKLCDELDDQARLIPALWRLATHHLMRGEIDVGVRVGHELIDRGTAVGGLPSSMLAGHMCLGMLLTHRGSQLEARRHLDQAIELCNAGHDAPIGGLLIEEPAVFSRIFSAINWSLLGDERMAEEHARRALAIGSRDGPHTYSTALALWALSITALLRRDAEATLRASDCAIEQATTYGYPLGCHSNGVHRGWALAMTGDAATGADLILEHSAACFALGAIDTKHFYMALLADALLMEGRLSEAQESIETGLEVVASTGEAWYEAELHRLRAEVFAAADPDDPRAAESFRTAIEIAASQGSDGLQRRAESSLARLLSN